MSGEDLHNAALPPIIQRMLESDYYPHPVASPIRLIQTHISYVMLTGNYVYKIKKAVNFGYLDFSTLEKRRHFCEEELRLNQRGAAGIYISVEPLLLNDEVVEYAVKMRQFPQECLLANLVDGGKFTESDAIELGRTVAEFHARADGRARISEFGQLNNVRAALDQNYSQTEQLAEILQDAQHLQDIRNFTTRFFAENAELFRQRMQDGKIRECHGDLHLGNICRFDGKLQLFDCIEFNESFRFIDVMADAAFVVMDFQFHGRFDLANAFLNSYTECTGDWEGLRALRLYLCRQAYVRAKVTCNLLYDPAVDVEKKSTITSIEKKYFDLAWNYTQPRQGRLILMCGISGTGKSTVASRLARKLDAVHIRSDALRKHLAGIPINQRGRSEVYSDESTRRTYSRLIELGAELARTGYPVILDAKFDRAEHRLTALHAARSNQLPFHILHLQAPIQQLRERLRKRNDPVADATAELLDAQFAQFEPFRAEERDFVIRIVATQNIEESCNSVANQILLLSAK
jgi:hypothetical protein